MLKFSQLSLRRGPRVLIGDASFVIHRGQRVGVTGGNGTGKSSLFALIQGELQPDAGEFAMPSGLVLAHVAQETPAVDVPAIDYVIAGDEELGRLQGDLAKAESDGDGHAQAQLHQRLDQVGGYDARARAARLMHGLGFTASDEDRPVRTFSGGWRVRLNLARALMCRSDLLLLDEPTNHLDLDAVIWLEEWLTSYPGTLLLISHDRDFLNRVVDHIAHIEHQAISLYPGNYDAFETVRAERLATRQSAYARQQREIAHMEDFVRRFRAKATKARQAQSRIKALERLRRIAPAHVDSPFHFMFREPRSLPDPLLILDQAAGGYADVTVLGGVKLRVSPGDRIGLLGPNGAGKSTLMKLVAGQLALQSGRRETARELAVGYFAQHQLEQLDPAASPLLHLQRLDATSSDQSLRDFLGGFGFQGDRVLDPVAPFSGGEKARLVLALLVWQQPNLLLLDEPTNHLDLEMRHALNVALQAFSGAVLLVSHDRHLLRTVADRLLLVDAGRVAEFDGDLDAYPAWLAERRRIVNGVDSRADGAHTAAARKELKRVQAEQRRQVQPLRNREQALSRRMDELTRSRQALEQRLADPALYEADGRTELLALLDEQARNRAELDAAEAEWLRVADQLEQLSG